MGKSIWGNRPRINFILKKPDGSRRTFQVIKKRVKKDYKPEYETVRNERIDAINAALLNGLQNFETCEIQLREVMAHLQEIERQKVPRVVHNEENQRALQAYWDKEYADRDLIDPKAAYNRLARAVEAIGELSVYSASLKELQKAINGRYRDNRQRDAAAALNQILAFIGRGIELKRRDAIIGDVHYLTKEELLEAQKHVESELDRLVQSAAFHTGLRMGELFAMTPESVRGAQFFSQYQLDRQLDLRATKRKLAQRRPVYVLPGGQESVTAWANLPKKTKAEMRNRKHAEVLKRACQKAFPAREDKHVVFHDLRHSYAIYLVSRGVNLTQVAQCLNNSVAVCERHYSGFLLKDETIESIKRIIEG